MLLPFGKFRGKRLSAVPDAYVGWLAGLPNLDRWPGLRHAVEKEQAHREKEAEKLRQAAVEAEKLRQAAAQKVQYPCPPQVTKVASDLVKKMRPDLPRLIRQLEGHLSREQVYELCELSADLVPTCGCEVSA